MRLVSVLWNARSSSVLSICPACQMTTKYNRCFVAHSNLSISNRCNPAEGEPTPFSCQSATEFHRDASLACSFWRDKAWCMQNMRSLRHKGRGTTYNSSPYPVTIALTITLTIDMQGTRATTRLARKTAS